MRALAKLIAVNDPDLVLFVGEALVGNEAVDQVNFHLKGTLRWLRVIHSEGHLISFIKCNFEIYITNFQMLVQRPS